MSKQLQSSLSLAALCALSLAIPAQADELDAGEVQNLRLSPGDEGIGWGALVMPTYSEQGQLEATLYNASDRPLYYMGGSLTSYLPESFPGSEVTQFGGFSGSVREVGSSQIDPHPTFVGFVEGTWTMDSWGHGDLHAIAYEVDGKGNWQPIGLISGEFDVLSIGVPQIEPQSFYGQTDFTAQSAGNQGQWGRPQELDSADDTVNLYRFASASAGAQNQLGGQQFRTGASLAEGLSYRYVAAMGEALRAQEQGSGFGYEAQRLRDMAQLSPFGNRSEELEERIAAARKQAADARQQAADANQTSDDGSGNFGSFQASNRFAQPVDVHLAGKIVVKYKIID